MTTVRSCAVGWGPVTPGRVTGLKIRGAFDMIDLIISETIRRTYIRYIQSIIVIKKL